jgi:hypothetical protein
MTCSTTVHPVSERATAAMALRDVLAELHEAGRHDVLAAEVLALVESRAGVEIDHALFARLVACVANALRWRLTGVSSGERLQYRAPHPRTFTRGQDDRTTRPPHRRRSS